MRPRVRPKPIRRPLVLFGLPTADLQPEEGVLAMSGWAKLPRCLTDALARGEIDFRDLALIAFFVVAIDWRTNEYVGDRTVIAHQSRWDLTEDYLSKKLRRLRKAGWLEFESEPGKRDAYVIRLGPKVRDPGL